MVSNTVSILDGSTFIVSDRLGNIDATPDQLLGLFFKDTRHLSRWILLVDGAVPDVLSTDDVKYYHAQFFLVPSTETVYENPYISLIRKRYAGEGFVEDITVFNHRTHPVDIVLRIEAGADFADLFEVKDAIEKRGNAYKGPRDGKLVLGYQHSDWVRETVISSSTEAEIIEDGFIFKVHLEPKASWETSLTVSPVAENRVITPKYITEKETPKPNIKQSLKGWLEDAPKIQSNFTKLRNTAARALVDLAALRFYPGILPGASLPAAGLPWFMALFGRDSIITSYQTIYLKPELAQTTLRVLAAKQGMKFDRFTEEEPGRILHELRAGELTYFKQRPQSPYYGTADATPLFLILLDEYERWTGDDSLVRELENNARAALKWIDLYGDRDGDGYVEYERTMKTGLENQCWKDSWNSILFADGSLPPLPRATCEIQGYVYDAKMRCARLAREFWNDQFLANRLEAEAAELKKRFNQDFWISDGEFFALALDGKKRKVDSLTSNIGHLLWSGIVGDDKVEPIVKHLMSRRLFSGWGVRTMADNMAGYNPIEYHNGTVWPHDNSIIAAGLARYGYREEANQIIMALFEAARYFNWRLPEVFAGCSRELTHYPTRYPTASSPQAWATGAPFLAVRVMLGLEPHGNELISDPFLPKEIDELSLLGIPGRWGRKNVIAENPGALSKRERAMQWSADRRPVER